MLKDKKRKRQKEETESPKKKFKLSETPASIVNKKTFKAKKNKNLPSLNLGAIASPSNFEPKEKKKRFKPKNANAKKEGANSSAEPAAQENFSKLFADLNSNKSKKRKFNTESPSKVGKASPSKQKIKVEQSVDVENFVSKKKKAKAKSPLKKNYGGSKLPSVEQAVEESPKKFSNDKKSHEFKKKKNKVKGESLSTDDSSKEVIGEKKVLNSEKPIKKKKKKEFVDKNLDKTLFVGNLPADITRKGLEKLFDKLGPVVESVRLRGAIPVNIRIPKKVAEIKHKFHESLHSRKGYVVFKTHEAAKAALSLNGTYVLGHHIIVDKAAKSGEKKTYDDSRSIFVGNLPFDVDDEQMWSAFSGCGEVEAVRVVRDPETGAGKGFGYVLFTDKSGKQAALSQDKLEVEGRIVRIKPVEGKQKTRQRNNNAQNFARRQAMKTKKTGDTPQSRKSSKKLVKKYQADKQKKHIAQAFKKFL